MTHHELRLVRAHFRRKVLYRLQAVRNKRTRMAHLLSIWELGREWRGGALRVPRVGAPWLYPGSFGVRQTEHLLQLRDLMQVTWLLGAFVPSFVKWR